MSTHPNFSAFLVLALFLVVVGVVQAITDKATGIAFPDVKLDKPVFGVGVRRKGPIKVYSVAMYCTEAVKDKLAACRKSDKATPKVLSDGAKEEGAIFSLHVNFKVGRDKIANSLVDSVAPRHKGAASEVEELKQLILKGVPEKGAAKGTTMEFTCSPSSLAVNINGKDQGNVESPALSSAFCDLYLDDKCSAPALRQSVLDNCCLD